jgi:hypothetical protein
MATKPRTKELCWRLIEKIEAERDLAVNAYHKLSGECEALLLERDRAMLEKCKQCKRGLR